MKAVVAILQADSALTTLLGSANKIFSGYVPQEETKPTVLVLSNIDDPNTTMSGQNLDEIQARVFSISNKEHTVGSTTGAREISDAVRTALNGYKGLVGSEQVANIAFESQGDPDVYDAPENAVEIEQIYQVFRRQ